MSKSIKERQMEPSPLRMPMDHVRCQRCGKEWIAKDGLTNQHFMMDTNEGCNNCGCYQFTVTRASKRSTPGWRRIRP